MATVIRLKKGGRTHDPYYRIVVMDSRERRQGKEIDIIGYYQPKARPNPITQIDGEKLKAWLEKGALPSDTVKTLMRKTGVTTNTKNSNV
ncbi:MAG TPA: 30S ribosomal protein S16 [Candidatus Hydrogenedens sp.]|nr:30S ribosomal protein S16 [Candidatus Hydrogenedens sp.]HOK09694.1 30S ribosomal protein S16 [Candidatus Hydrogenedens sp.]HOL19283.1 30S ribosomal protein S16 [Candidatus Hydrogenedens sp.]HPP59236.1 30S ribosomal protein S16 [Candidatus Hydrogenedens sp.]